MKQVLDLGVLSITIVVMLGMELEIGQFLEVIHRKQLIAWGNVIPAAALPGPGYFLIRVNQVEYAAFAAAGCLTNAPLVLTALTPHRMLPGKATSRTPTVFPSGKS